MKVAKRLIRENIGSDGKLNTDKFLCPAPSPEYSRQKRCLPCPGRLWPELEGLLTLQACLSLLLHSEWKHILDTMVKNHGFLPRGVE